MKELGQGDLRTAGKWRLPSRLGRSALRVEVTTRRILTPFLIATFIFTSLTPSIATNHKAGATCKKLGQITNYSGKKFTCVKSGKKLVWDKGTPLSKSQAAPQVTPSPSPNTSIEQSIPFLTQIEQVAYRYLKVDLSTGKPTAQISNEENFLSVDRCKLVEANHWGTGTSAGYFQSPSRVQLSKNPKIVLVPVDFSDVPSKARPAVDFLKYQKALTEFFSRAAGVPVQFDWQIPNSYIRMSNTLKSYDVGGNLFAKTWDPVKQNRFLEKVFKETDPFIDFSNTSAVIMIAPPDTPANILGTFMVWPLIPGEEYETAEGKIPNVLGMGGEFIDEYTYIHEFGHALGLTDPRNVADVANQKSDGLGIYDIMAGSILPELLIWHRFILEITGAKQVHCINSKESSTHWLRPVASNTTEAKGVVIPFDANTGMVVETRRRHGYDYLMGRQSEGVIVYKIDTNMVHPNSPYRLIQPSRSVDREWERDAALKQGESVQFNGWRVTLIESGSFGDVVKIENIGGPLSTVFPKASMKPVFRFPCGFRCGSDQIKQPATEQPKQNPLAQPEFESIAWSGNQATLKVKVSAEAEGAYVEIEELNIGAQQTKSKKNQDGMVDIKINIPSTTTQTEFSIFLFAYSSNNQSLCCSSIGTRKP